jgi:zinc carboxypeptidase
MPAIAFDRFHRYAELTDIVHALAREHPNLLTIESIGKSHEGRDIWVLTATSAATGPAADKPAYWVDRMKIEWVVRAPKGTTVRAIARHERAGIVRADIGLG